MTLNVRRLVVVATVLLLPLTLISCSAPAGSLTNTSNYDGLCQGATSTGPDSWTKVQQTEYEFGVDLINLRNESARPTITDVKLVEVQGDLTLKHVMFIPGGWGGVGLHSGWDNIKSTSNKTTWPLRIKDLPATLYYLAPTPELTKDAPGFDGHTWQVVLGLQTETGNGGSAKHIRITYTEHGHTHHLDGHFFVSIYPNCDMDPNYSHQPTNS